MRRDAQAKEIQEKHVPIDLFDPAKALGIFSAAEMATAKKEDQMLTTWEQCNDREMKIRLTQRPRNMLEDMASMTDKGILWHFPINNEQGIEETEVGNQGRLKRSFTTFIVCISDGTIL